MDFLFEHRSIRKYKSDPVDDQLLNRILQAGTRASNTGNMQLYSVIVSRKKDRREELAPFHFNQAMVTEAPVLLTVCADVNRFNRWCELKNADAGYNNLVWLVNAIVDAMLFAQNICIAAETQGLGICYLGTTLYHANELIKALNLPAGVAPVTAITMGYPDQEPPLVDRLPLEAIVHDEAYRNDSNEEILAFFEEKEKLESSKRFVAENNKENLAQVFTDVRYKQADNLFFSEKLLKTLKEQGFEI